MVYKYLSHILYYFYILIFGYYDEELNEEYNNISVLQKNESDCGIACLEMVLKWKKCHNIDFDGKIIIENLSKHEISSRKTPLWTIGV
jgi:hypothetical protein